MLVLTRKPGEKIVLSQGDDVLAIVTVTSNSDSSRIKLGVTAPRHIRIDRFEVAAEKGLVSEAV